MTELFTGQYECRRDDRGRLRLPAEIVNRHAEDDGNFMLRKGLDDCVELYPMDVWRRVSKRVNDLDTMVRKQRIFQRRFFQNSKDVKLDGNSRMIIPANLASHANIDRDVIIIAMGDRYEIWDLDTHAAEAEGEEDDSDLANEIFGNSSSQA